MSEEDALKALAGRTGFSYIRFSSQPQEWGTSLTRQLQKTREFASEVRLHLDETIDYRDLGVSAFRSANAKTGALSAFLNGIKEGRVPQGSVLLIEALDRLSRAELSESLAIFLQIINAGVDIVAVNDRVVFTKTGLDTVQVLLTVIQLSSAHSESRIKSVRVHEGWAIKRKRASEKLGTIRITKIAPAWLTPIGDAGWKILPEREAIVREIFEMYDGGIGKWGIAAELNRRGVVPWSSPRFTVHSFSGSVESIAEQLVVRPVGAVSLHLSKLLPATHEKLQATVKDISWQEELRRTLTRELNVVIESGLLPISHEWVPPREKTKSALAQRPTSGNELTRLNRLILEDLYPEITKKSEIWHAKVVALILTNPAVIGTFRPGHWEGNQHRHLATGDIPGYYPAIIDPAIFQRCCDRLRGRYNRSGPQGQHVFLLSGLVWVENERTHKYERAFIANTSTRKRMAEGGMVTYRYRYYISQSTLACKSRDKAQHWNVDYLERSVLAFASMIDWNQIAMHEAKPAVDYQDQLDKISRRLKEIERELSRLGDAVAEGGQMRTLTAKITERENEAEKLRKTQDDLARAIRSQAEPERVKDGEQLYLKVLEGTVDNEIRKKIHTDLKKRIKRILLPASTGFSGKTKGFIVQFASGAVRKVVTEGKYNEDIAAIFDDSPIPEELSNMPITLMPDEARRQKTRKKESKLPAPKNQH